MSRYSSEGPEGGEKFAFAPIILLAADCCSCEDDAMDDSESELFSAKNEGIFAINPAPGPAIPAGPTNPVDLCSGTVDDAA